MSGYSVHLARINRVFDHIDAHLAEPLDLEQLAAVACLSPFHFHRVFRRLTGETLAERVRRRRVEVAAARLIGEPQTAVGHIALDVGFASPEVFARAFRAGFGMSASQWRAGGHRRWAQARQAALSKIRQAEGKKHQVLLERLRKDTGLWPHGRVAVNGDPPMDVCIRTLPARRIAYMRHVGPYGSASITAMWQRFGTWCRRSSRCTASARTTRG